MLLVVLLLLVLVLVVVVVPLILPVMVQLFAQKVRLLDQAHVPVAAHCRTHRAASRRNWWKHGSEGLRSMPR
jgi:hypothetical protein